MTKKEAQEVLKLLNHVKSPDGHVERCKAILNKEIEKYNAMRGQLKETYETDSYPW